STDARVIALVGAVHFVSHIYIVVLPPLFPFVRADFGVSYTELGIALAIFNILTGLLQTPAGFLVDRFSARAVLIGGLLLGAASLAAASFVSSFYVFVAMFALLGVANATYHPADYSLLSGRVSPPRMSQAYSIHIFAGFAGTAAAPATLLILAGSLGWRGAFLAAAALGVFVAAVILFFGDVMACRDPARIKEKETGEKGADSRILLSAPILLSLCFYMLLAMAGGLQIYGIVALEALWGTSLSLATTAITAYLAMSAFAVLVGGYVSARTDRHDLVAVTGLALNALALLPVAFFDLGAAALIGLLGLSGFCNGVLQPSRDMIVRAVTPPGAFGRVFGFVTTGFNIGGVIAPPVFGYLMDNGEPRLVIIGVVLCALVSIPTVMITVAQRAKKT
ncbi:MAG TPA: MFS transporter, partial [Pseudorhodoplanes sp.]|nr:MFS transporter [Pseudorhodoplanes sp.]